MKNTDLTPPRYLSFMLRCRETSIEGADPAGYWRFSLEDARSGEMQAFPDLGSLVAFLETQLAASQADRNPQPGSQPAT
jgi:hypothetical protein